MAKVNIAKEIVDNHSEEEVLSWMEDSIKSIVINLEKPEDVSVALGEARHALFNIYLTLSELNQKHNPKGPVVAG